MALCISYFPTRTRINTFYLILIRMLGDRESQYYLDEIYMFLLLLPLGHFFLNPQRTLEVGLCICCHLKWLLTVCSPTDTYLHSTLLIPCTERHTLDLLLAWNCSLEIRILKQLSLPTTFSLSLPKLSPTKPVLQPHLTLLLLQSILVFQFMNILPLRLPHDHPECQVWAYSYVHSFHISQAPSVC